MRVIKSYHKLSWFNRKFRDEALEYEGLMRRLESMPPSALNDSYGWFKHTHYHLCWRAIVLRGVW